MQPLAPVAVFLQQCCCRPLRLKPLAPALPTVQGGLVGPWMVGEVMHRTGSYGEALRAIGVVSGGGQLPRVCQVIQRLGYGWKWLKVADDCTITESCRGSD